MATIRASEETAQWQATETAVHTRRARRRHRGATLPGWVALWALWAVPAVAQESRTDKSILGFTKDQKQMLVRIDDANTGLGLRLYDVATGEAAAKTKLIEFERGDEVATVKSAKKRFKIVDDGVESMKTPDEAIAFFGVEKAEKLVIAATDYKRLGKVMDVPLKEDPETKKKAQARLGTIMWTTDRKTMVLVVRQKISGDFLFEKDYFHAVPFEQRKIMWVEPEPKKEEKKEEKEEKKDKGWWPF